MDQRKRPHFQSRFLLSMVISPLLEHILCIDIWNLVTSDFCHYALLVNVVSEIYVFSEIIISSLPAVLIIRHVWES